MLPLMADACLHTCDSYCRFLEGWREMAGVTHGLLARILLGVQEDTKTVAIALLTPEVNDYIYRICNYSATTIEAPPSKGT